jgi:hypothetical protein
VRGVLAAVTDRLGEDQVGGLRDPKDDIWGHTRVHLQAAASERRAALVETLGTWALGLGRGRRVRMLMCLWQESSSLWERSVAYRTIQAVADAAVSITGPDRPEHDWEAVAWCAVAGAFGLMPADGAVFRETNLSRASSLAVAARDAAATAARIRDGLTAARLKLEAAPGADGDAGVIRDGLIVMARSAGHAHSCYSALVPVADSLAEFVDWLAAAPRPAASQLRSVDRAPGSRPLALERAPLISIRDALARLSEVISAVGAYTQSVLEPWEHLLSELEALVSGPDQQSAACVFIPRRVWIRYCFPFAVEEDGQRSRDLLYPSAAGQAPDGIGRHFLSWRLQAEFDALLGPGQLTVSEPVNLAQTEFFQTRAAGQGLYGGIRIGLPDLELITDAEPGGNHGGPGYQVWLDLNRMGNFCLCVESREPREDVPPHELYRVLRAGTVYAYGEAVALAAPPGMRARQGPPAWDNLHAFARDVIRAAADAYFWADEQPRADKQSRNGAAVAPYVRGSLHEVVVMQTDGPLGVQSEEIADSLDRAVGGRILFRSALRPAATLDEWVRFPPLQRAGKQHQEAPVVTASELGLVGDWFIHAAETTVFGVVATPAWLRDMYPEVAQFASSWSPLLQLWNKRLERAISETRPARTPAADPADIRKIEQQVRRHLTQVNSEELCSNLVYRRFLDELLEAVGVSRLERELEAQLKAAEQLTDWFRAQEEQRGARRRDKLLFFIAILGVFSLADFLSLIDTTRLRWNWGFIRLTVDGPWQVWFVLVAFIVTLTAGLIIMGAPGWLRQRLARLASRRRRRPGA